jgi:hypothetical protein
MEMIFKLFFVDPYFFQVATKDLESRKAARVKNPIPPPSDKSGRHRPFAGPKDVWGDTVVPWDGPGKPEGLPANALLSFRATALKMLVVSGNPIAMVGTVKKVQPFGWQHHPELVLVGCPVVPDLKREGMGIKRGGDFGFRT